MGLGLKILSLVLYIRLLDINASIYNMSFRGVFFGEVTIFSLSADVPQIPKHLDKQLHV